MRNKGSLIALAIIALVTVLGCSRFTGQNNASNASPTSSPGTLTGSRFTLSGKEWKTVELADMDIKVDLPGDPADKTPSPSQLPSGWDQVFSSMKIHAYDNADFGSSYSQLVPTGKRQFTIKELAETSMAALKKQARDLDYKLDIKSPSNAKYDGTFTRNGKNFELRGCCIFQKSNPSRVWAVITVFPKDSADGRTASERIISSAAFTGSTETCN